MLFVASILITPSIKRFLLGFVRSFNTQNSGLVSHFFGRAPFRRTSFCKKYLGKPAYVKFESMLLPVPSNVEAYLAVRFGPKFMELPSAAEKLKYPSHAHIVDVNTSFESYFDD
jgi:lipopolysaccharide cholinephosphotransferase